MLLETYKKKDIFKEQDMLKEIIRLAFQAGASDLHWQSEHDGSYLRIRKDGILKTILTLPHDEYDRYVGTIKFLSDLKINVDFMPQDGRMNFETLMT
jgi:type IV pilus assembly protein PilB